MRNSTILFVLALLVLAWFGSETFTAQNICVTSCIDLSGLSLWEQAVIVAFFPLLLALIGIGQRRSEKVNQQSQVPKTD